MSTPTPNTTSAGAGNVTIAKDPNKNLPATANNQDEKGKTVIDEDVVSKVAGIATREVPGVYALGGGVARALGAIRDAVGNTDLSQGVSVEVGEKQVAVDVTLIVEYPKPIQQVADAVRNAVYNAIEKLVGLEVVEVNVTVTDIHIPSEDDKKDKKPEKSSKDQNENNETARVQ